MNVAHCGLLGGLGSKQRALRSKSGDGSNGREQGLGMNPAIDGQAPGQIIDEIA
jgi:hypothetical protein